MSLPWTLSLVATIAIAMVLRITSRQLPLPSARPVSAAQLAALGFGVLGLVGHCTAMFFTHLAQAVPGSGGYIDGVNGMGVTSMVLYAVPALLVIAGLWRVARWALATVVATLVLVGVTMYNGGPLTVHLVAIVLSVIALAGTMAALVRGRDERQSLPGV